MYLENFQHIIEYVHSVFVCEIQTSQVELGLFRADKNTKRISVYEHTCIYFKSNPAKFHPDLTWNEGP